MYIYNSNSIVLLREESTCRYKVKVELQILCSLYRFAPIKPNVMFTFVLLYYFTNVLLYSLLCTYIR